MYKISGLERCRRQTYRSGEERDHAAYLSGVINTFSEEEWHGDEPADEEDTQSDQGIRQSKAGHVRWPRDEWCCAIGSSSGSGRQ